MELSQLRAILALSELASFTRAAEKLHLSAPAVFNQVRQLEEQLSGRLYERVGRRLVLTIKGRALAEYASQIVDAHDRALKELSNGSASTRTVLRIGSGPYSSARIVPHLVKALVDKRPEVELHLVTGDDKNLLKDLWSNTIDVALMSLPLGDPSVLEEPLWQYEMVFVIPPKRFCEWNGRNSISELSEKPFILFKRPVGIESAIKMLSNGSGFSPRVVLEHDDPASIKELVKLGIGFSVLPLFSVGDDLKRHEVRVLRGAEPSILQYGLVYRRDCCNVPGLSAFRKAAQTWQKWWPQATYVSPAPVAFAGDRSSSVQE